MFVRSSYMADRPEGQPYVHVPMVYERVTHEPSRWEYHVLAVDTRETPLPDASQLNTLGQEGWIMVGVLDERAAGKSGMVFYYFTRRAKD